MRLIDADLFDAIVNDDGTIDEYATETAKNAMLIMPTVDAVPVIRCKDCKWWPYHPIERQIGYVKTFLCAMPPALKEDANGFCSMAERKDNG